MDIRKVKKLIELIEESGIAEIEIHEGEESVRISRGSSMVAPQATTPVAQALMPVTVGEPTEQPSAPIANATADNLTKHLSLIHISEPTRPY